MEKQEPFLHKSETTRANNKLHGHAMLKKEKPMLSVAALIQAHGKLWDRQFAGNEEGLVITLSRGCTKVVLKGQRISVCRRRYKTHRKNIGHV